MLKSRRRWALVAGALLVALVGVGGASYPSLKDGEWLRGLPGSVLIGIIDDPDPDLLRGLSKPIEDTPKFQRIAIDEVWKRYAAGDLPLAERRALLKKMFARHPPVVFHTRARWPVGVPIRARVETSGGPLPRTVVVTPQFEGGIEMQRSQPEERAVTAVESLGALPLGARDVSCRVRFLEDAAEVWTATKDLRIEVVGTLDEAIEPLSTPEAVAALRDFFGACARINPQSKQLVLLAERDPDRRAGLGLIRGVCVAVIVEVRHLDVVVARARVDWTGDPDLFSWFPLEMLGKGFPGSPGSQPGWTMRVRPDPEGALANFEATKYWAGDFEAAVVWENR
jgi:hypothetical protein